MCTRNLVCILSACGSDQRAVGCRMSMYSCQFPEMLHGTRKTSRQESSYMGSSFLVAPS
jgi:hypothetical protein